MGEKVLKNGLRVGIKRLGTFKGRGVDIVLTSAPYVPGRRQLFKIATQKLGKARPFLGVLELTAGVKPINRIVKSGPNQ